jgi:hypothetical protein
MRRMSSWIAIGISAAAFVLAALSLWRTEVRAKGDRRDRLGSRVELRHVNGGSNTEGTYLDTRVENVGAGTARELKMRLLADGEEFHPIPQHGIVSVLASGAEIRVRFPVARSVMDPHGTNNLTIPPCDVHLAWRDEFGSWTAVEHFEPPAQPGR